LAVLTIVVACTFALVSRAEQRIYLNDNWSVRPSYKVKESGDKLSVPGINTSAWHKATVPNTVLAVMAADSTYKDVYFGKNLRKIGGNFPKPFDVYGFAREPWSPFYRPWWYRTEFETPAMQPGQRLWLNFNGINFKADIWVNGKKVADNEDAAGPFRLFSYDITDLLKPGQINALAVQVYQPTGEDLAITWVDWNPAPPDRDMGLWRHVFLETTGPVILRFPAALSDIDIPALDKAHLTVIAEATNATDREVIGTLKGSIGDIKFSQEVKLNPKETKVVKFTPDQFDQLNMKNPKLWWPYDLGPQNLYDLDLAFEINSAVSDSRGVKFGIRKVTSEMTKDGYRMFKINGKNILIRGAGWASDMMLRYDPERLENEIRYVKEMNLNAIRLEGKLESDKFYEICDREGILVMPGWCCCDHWERWSRWDWRDYKVAKESLNDQSRRLRQHPSVFVWLDGSDNPPPPDVEAIYLKVLEKNDWPNPVISSASAKETKVSGKTGVKMTGPYEWVPPAYWLLDKDRGGAWGFNMETSPGPAVPPIESIIKMVGEKHLWPINSWWNYHCGRGAFGNLLVFSRALDNRYGKAASAEDYAKKSQAMTYESERAMFEAFGRNKYTSTGVIQWMLNTAWPGMIWHLYDWYLLPGGGYFGAKHACERVHIQYGYDDNSVSAVNSYYRDFNNLKASIKIYNLDMSEKFSDEKTVNLPEDSSVKVMVIPDVAGLSQTYFLKLELKDADNKVVSSNFYWLSTRMDVLDWRSASWYQTPAGSFANFTDLQKLPQVELKVSKTYEKSGDEGINKITIENPSSNLAFMVRLKVVKGKEEILPVFWSDNYFSLLPGEKKEVVAKNWLKDIGPDQPGLEVTGWNIQTQSY
jgi:exo-1,4-beta-D-glucosaminidase